VLQADHVALDENDNTVAEGNVSIELPQGILRTERLTYNRKDGIIEIPGAFVMDTKRGALGGSDLRYSLTDEKGFPFIFRAGRVAWRERTLLRRGCNLAITAP